MTAPTKLLIAPPSGITYHDPGILRPRSDISWSGEVGNVDIRFQWDTDSAFGGGTNEVVSLEYENATAGSYDLSFDSVVSNTIQWDDDAAAIKTAIEAAANVHSVTVTGSGTVADPFLVEFTDPINGGRNIPDMVVNSDSLVGDTVVLAIGTQGVTGPPIDIVILNDSTNSIERAPTSDLGLAGPHFWRVAVVDRDDGLGTFSLAQTLNYHDPIDHRRYLSHQANVGVGFTPTDDPGAGWGTGGTVGPDGDTIDPRRYLSHQANVGVAFEPKDKPAPGWGTGGTTGADGHNRDDFRRYLSHQANVDATQPCPFLFSLSAAQVRAGDALTVKGQGLVSASSPTADAWDAEVRLYESPSFAAAFVTLAITTWVAGSIEDSITATVPGGASTGFIAVVHTTTPTCDVSNFLGVTIIEQDPDRKAGWWVEVWNLRNTTKIVSPIPLVHEATFEHIANDIGNGELVLRGDDVDVADIIDRSTEPETQSLVKVYLHDRFAYAFIPDDSDEDYDEDGARQVRLFGDGQERILKWGRVLWKDFPSQPTSTRTWLYGSTSNQIPWANMEAESTIDNGGIEDADTDPAVAVGTAALSADTAEARTGTYSLRVTPAATDDGVEWSYGIVDARRTYADLWIKTNLPGNNPTYTVELLDDEDAVVATTNVLPASSVWIPVNLDDRPTADGTYRLRITQTAGTLTRFWLDDVAAYSRLKGTIDESRVRYSLSRDEVAGGLHSMELPFDAGGDVTFNGIVIFFPVVPNEDYTLTVPISGPVGDIVRVAARLGGTVDSVEQVLTGLGTFDSIVVTGTAGPDETTSRIAISSKESAALTVYVDEMTIRPGAPAANAGTIVTDIHTAMAARGTLDFIILGFDATLDSSGVAWPENLRMEIPPEWTLWDLCEKLIGLGYDAELVPVNWRGGGDTGWELNVYGPLRGGIDWTLFADGPAILPSDTVRNVEPSSAPPAETVAYGEGAGGVWSVATASAARITALERREGFVKAAHAKDSTSLFRIVSHRLDVSLDRGSQFTADLTDDADPLPYFDFIPFDRLRAHLPTDGTRDAVPDDTYRTAAIVFRGTAEGIGQEYEVDFGKYRLYAERLRDLITARIVARETSENYRPGTGSVSSGRAGGGSTPPSSDPLDLVAVPPHDHVWSDVGPAIGGDLAGTFPNPAVAGLRGRRISSVAPADLDELAYDDPNSQWAPRAGPSSGTATIADSSTTEVVAHGLAATPVVVIATPGGDERIWITTIGGTNFTVNRSGSTGALVFYWRAIP